MRYILFLMIFSTSLSWGQSDIVKFRDHYLESLSKIDRDLFLALEKVAKDNGVALDHVNDLLKTKFLGSSFWPACGKGSHGVIGNDIYVKTKSDVNQISYGIDLKKDDWVGSDKETTQLLVMEGNDVKGSFDLSKQDLKLFLFEPESVSYFEWETLSGGHYQRNCK